MIDPQTFGEIQSHVNAGRFAEADAICLRLVDQEAANPQFWQLRGSIALLAEKWLDAEAHYRWTLSLVPEAAEAWLGIARACASSERLTPGAAAAEQALRLGLNDDNTIAAHEIIAHALFSRGEVEAGRSHLATILPLYAPKFASGIPESHILRGALSSALCGGNAALVKRFMEIMHPHAGRMDPVRVAPLAKLEDWCGRNQVPCQVIEPPTDMRFDSTSPYSRGDSYTTEAVLFASIPRGQWVPGWDYIIGSDGTVLEDSGYLRITHVFNHAPHAHFPEAQLVAHRWPDRAEYVDEDVVVLSAPMHNHIGHWMIDFLPRLLGRDHADCRKIVIPESASSGKQVETLAIAGLREADVIRCRLDTRYQFRTLHFYRHGQSMPPNPMHVRYVRDLLRGDAKGDAPKPGKRFFFSRDRIGMRLVINDAEFQKVLADHGFTTVDLPTLSFAEQKALFADAEIMIGALGTDLFAMYFAPPGCTVISMQWDPGWEADPYVPQTCAVLGLRHQFLICPETRKSKGARSWMDLDFHVDCTELDRRIREISSLSAEAS